MELMIIIVQEQDYPKLSSTFIHNRVMATKFSTEGLYLNKKNITLMVCIEKERESWIISARAVQNEWKNVRFANIME